MSDTNFDTDAYIAGLQTLLDRQSVAVTVKGLTAEQGFEKFSAGPIAELVVESFELSQIGVTRKLAGTLRAGLLVSKKIAGNAVETEVFELALSVATSLWDELAEESEDDSDDGDVAPVHGAGPIMVTGVEPSPLDGALQHRVVSYLVSFEQEWVISRVAQPSEPVPPDTLFVGRSPNTGDEGGDADDYTQLVPQE